MSFYQGKRTTVIGLGRAGVGLGKTLSRVGATVTVVDQKSGDNPNVLEASDYLSGLGIEVVTSWTGGLDWDDLDLIAVSPGVPKTHPTLMEAQRRGVPIHGEPEVAYRISKAPMIAITGTNGKSTVTALTWHILKEQGFDAVLCGNIAGSGFSEQVMTLAALGASEKSILVAEVSSFQLEWVDEFRPKSATIVSITPDHLDRYGSADEYAFTKHRIFGKMGEGDFIVVHAERTNTQPRTSSARRFTVGPRDADALIDGQRLIMRETGAQLNKSDLWFPSQYNLENCAFAMLLARPFGSDDLRAIEAVKTFRGIMNRMELVAIDGGVSYINNSMCTNPAAVESSLAAVDAPVILLAGGVSKVEDLSPITRVAPRLKFAYLFGRDGNKINEALREGGCQTEVCADLSAAVSRARAAAAPGDSVVLAPGCASFDQFDSFIERGELFRALIKEFAHV